MLDSFATFFLLSYIKVLNVSFDVLTPTQLGSNKSMFGHKCTVFWRSTPSLCCPSNNHHYTVCKYSHNHLHSLSLSTLPKVSLSLCKLARKLVGSMENYRIWCAAISTSTALHDHLPSQYAVITTTALNCICALATR